MNRHVLGKLWSRYGVRKYAVLTAYAFEDHPELSMTVGRRANLTRVYKDYLLDEQPRGTICHNNERDRRPAGSARYLNNIRVGRPCTCSKRIGKLPESVASRSQCTSLQGQWSWWVTRLRSRCPLIERQWRLLRKQPLRRLCDV